MDGYGISYDRGRLVYSNDQFIDYLNDNNETYFSYNLEYDRYIGNFFRAAYSYKKKYLITIF